VLTSDHTDLPATHMFIQKCNEPHLPLLPAAERHRSLPVLISHTAEGRELSWPGWLITYRDGTPAKRSPISVLTGLDEE